MKIGIIGGTGKEGRGLAMRWARADHQVVIGSRDPDRAIARAAELSERAGATITGGSNAEAAQSDVVVLTVPYSAHAATITGLRDALAHAIVVDITVPLVPPAIDRVTLPQGGAAALEAAAILDNGARVVAALHHVSSVHLSKLDHTFDADALACGDDRDAVGQVIGLIADLGIRAFDAGPLANAVALESLTPVLLFMNKSYKRKGVGMRIVGIEDEE